MCGIDGFTRLNPQPAIEEDTSHLRERWADQKEAIWKLVWDRLQLSPRVALERRVNLLVTQFDARCCDPVACLLNLAASLPGSATPAMIDQHRNPGKGSWLRGKVKVDSGCHAAQAELHSCIAPSGHIVRQHCQTEARRRIAPGSQALDGHRPSSKSRPRISSKLSFSGFSAPDRTCRRL